MDERMSILPGISIVVPCFNEQGNLELLTSRIRESLSDSEHPWELILVDDGSADGTWSEITRLQDADPNHVVGVQHSSNKGIACAWESGAAKTRREFVCLMDADLQNPPEALPMLLDTLKQPGVDVVQAARSSLTWAPDQRYRISRILNRILNLAFNDDAMDNKSGYIAARRFVMIDILSSASHIRTFQTFIRQSARARGYRVTEIVVPFFPRNAGESFLTGQRIWTTSFQVILDIISALRHFGRGTKPPLEQFPPESWIFRNDEAHRNSIPKSGLRENLYFFTMPLHAWLLRGKQTKRAYRNLLCTEELTKQDLRRLQEFKLQRLIHHAYTHLPYYRARMQECDITPADVVELEDLDKFPQLEKSDVRRNLHYGLISQTAKRSELHKISTSGSTGEPFTVYADQVQLEYRFATTLRALTWSGWKFGDRSVRLWHQKLGMSKSQAFRERFDAFLMRRKFVPAFEWDDAGIRSMMRVLNESQPKVIDGYAESLNFLAKIIEMQGELKFSPESVVSSAQVLPSQTRDTIQRVLGAKVLDKYGAREFSGIAYECREQSGHHVMAESYVVELRAQGRRASVGERGEVVITDLNNFSMPLIRYRIGDLAEAVSNEEQCACGVNMHRIGEIVGRTQALVHAANGRWLPGTFFAHFFKEYEEVIRNYQIVQTEFGKFTLRYVPSDTSSSQGISNMLDNLRAYVGDTHIDLEDVEVIPLLATGKRSPVVSSLRVDFQELGNS